MGVMSEFIPFPRFGLVWFYGISTTVGYLMPNPIYTYILNIYMMCKHICREHSFLHTVKWFQVLLYNSYNLTSVICLRTVCSIWPIVRTQSGATTWGQSGLGSNGNEGYSTSPNLQGWSLAIMSYPGQ